MKDAFESSLLNESFWVICLNRKNKSLGRNQITSGTLNSSLVRAREVFRIAILSSASAIVVVHNHPSGDPSPSSADVHVTRQLRKASQILDIALLDHVICGDPEDDPQIKGFYSFSEAGLL